MLVIAAAVAFLGRDHRRHHVRLPGGHVHRRQAGTPEQEGDRQREGGSKRHGSQHDVGGQVGEDHRGQQLNPVGHPRRGQQPSGLEESRALLPRLDGATRGTRAGSGAITIDLSGRTTKDSSAW
ncbi:hypothetical protein HCN51_55265 [Nonomuraea sp. FMUSA5-5]|uniref:Uncharacterized protein n=1 Tax=Nonomuraea composti TaxID=2720023 RepID=A0ABX1BPG6_9ACTN|nr:hypothetical protein [Nonomuraea sp. FMUSA5-5]NJP98489.1 hypothetical protein [Nonomuraea sp. FMUSA5-5]